MCNDIACFDPHTKELETETTALSNVQTEEEKETTENEDLEATKVGTPYYLAPEIWKTQSYGKPSDIWSLGVILYELCCLKYPFPATQLEELEKKVLNDKIAPVQNNVNKDFIDLFNKMLKKDPTQRPTIEEIIYSDIF